MIERDSLKALDEALSILEQGFSAMPGEDGVFMVMPGGMTIRPNGQAGIACPVLPAEQESVAGELAASASQNLGEQVSQC